MIAGVDPRHAASYDEKVDERIRAAVQAGKVHAIGSCGLNAANSNDANREDSLVEEQAFRSQIKIAREFDLPLVVQAGGSHLRAHEILLEEAYPFDQVLVRAFDGSREDLQRWVQAGCYVSFGGWSADDPLALCRLVDNVPTDRVLVESGAPDQAIDLLSGYPSRCDQVVFVADAIISHVSAQQLAANAAAFYRL